jgi:hypothetical protein
LHMECRPTFPSFTTAPFSTPFTASPFSTIA